MRRPGRSGAEDAAGADGADRSRHFVGRRAMTCFRAEPVSQHLPFTRHPICLSCRREFTAVARIVTFYVGGELVGFVCSGCVSSEARELLRSGGS